MNLQLLEEKNKELLEKFDAEQKDAKGLEEQIATLQTKFQEKAANMIRLQGAFAVIQDLIKAEKEAAKTPEK